MAKIPYETLFKSHWNLINTPWNPCVYGFHGVLMPIHIQLNQYNSPNIPLLTVEPRSPMAKIKASFSCTSAFSTMESDWTPTPQTPRSPVIRKTKEPMAAERPARRANTRNPWGHGLVHDVHGKIMENLFWDFGQSNDFFGDLPIQSI